MRVQLFLLAAVIAGSCGNHEHKKASAFHYLNKEIIFNRDSVNNFLADVSEKQIDSSKAVFLKAVDLLKNGKNPNAAIESFLQSLSIYPAANTYYELGNAFLQQKEWQKGLQSFEMAEAMGFTPIGSALFGQASCYAEMDSSEKTYTYLRAAIQSGFVDRVKILNNPHFANYINDGYLITIYNEAMSGNGDPDEILWQGYSQDFTQAAFPLKVDSGSFRRMGEPNIISYDYEKFVPEMRDNKFSRDVGSEYFYVNKIMQTELYNVVLYGCRSYEYEGAPVHYILASFDSKGKLIDKMIVGGAKTFDDNYKEFTAQSHNRFLVEEYKNSYEKSIEEEGYANNKIVNRSLVATHHFAIDGNGKFVTSQNG